MPIELTNHISEYTDYYVSYNFGYIGWNSISKYLLRLYIFKIYKKFFKRFYVLFVYRLSYFTPLLNLSRSIDMIMAYILVHIMIC